MSSLDWYNHKAEEILDKEIQARTLREAAFASALRTPIAPYDKPVIDPITGHVFGTFDTQFQKWSWFRDKYIETGEQKHLDAMLSYVVLADSDLYDEVARA